MRPILTHTTAALALLTVAAIALTGTVLLYIFNPGKLREHESLTDLN